MAENTNAVENVLLGETVAEVVAKINAGIVQVNANATSVKKLEEAVEKLEDSAGDAGKVDDVQINGTSIVADKIANIQFSGADGIVVTPDNTGKVSISAPTIAGRFETLNNTLFGENGSSAVKEASKVTNKLKILTEEDTYTEYDGSAEKEIDSVYKANKVANILKLYTSEIGYSSYDGSKEVSINHIARATGDYNGDAIHTTYVKIAKIGVAEGVASLDKNGKVPSIQLPSYVDDVLEYDSQSAFPETGETGKIYLAIDTNKQYRWSGSQYVEISSSLALGETSSTAYAGDKGKANADDIAKIKADYVRSSEQFKKDEILVAVEPITDNTKEGFNNGRGIKSSGYYVTNDYNQSSSRQILTAEAVRGVAYIYRGNLVYGLTGSGEFTVSTATGQYVYTSIKNLGEYLIPISVRNSDLKIVVVDMDVSSDGKIVITSDRDLENGSVILSRYNYEDPYL